MRDAKYLVVIALLIIAVTVVPIIFAFEKIRQVDAIFAEFAQALQAKEYERAYSLGTLEFKKAISLQEFEDGQRRLEARYGSLQSVSKQGYSVKGVGIPVVWVARIDAGFRYPNNTVICALEFHHIEGQWRLYGLKVLR